jgi:hypothetical protein
MIKSVLVCTEYDKPFHVQIDLKTVSNEYRTPGEKIKEYILNWKGAFLDIEDGFWTSNEGDGSRQYKSTCDFIGKNQ